jgi:hypothetical protein
MIDDQDCLTRYRAEINQIEKVIHKIRAVYDKIPNFKCSKKRERAKTSFI